MSGSPCLSPFKQMTRVTANAVSLACCLSVSIHHGDIPEPLRLVMEAPDSPWLGTQGQAKVCVGSEGYAGRL